MKIKTNLVVIVAILFLVIGIGSLGLLKGLVREGFVGDVVVKACDRDNDCPDGYLCDSQTCVKTKQYSY